MTKTPEQMAEEWADNDIAPQILQSAGPYKLAEESFFAGYQAAKDQLADGDKVMGELSRAFDQGYQSAKAHYQTDWISVKERLPEMNVVALVFSKLTYLNVAHRVVDDKGWCWATVSMSIAPYEITHWMPLPEAPKGEE